MKNKLLLFIVILFNYITSLSAQIDSTVISESTSTIKVDAISHETMNVSGSVSVAIQVTALDTAYIDNLWFGETSIFNLSWNGIFSQTTLYSNNTATANITVTYNSTALPFYPKQFEVLVRSRNAHNDVSVNMVQVIVYFTPHNSTEVWSRDDFWALPRLWFMPEANTPEPARVFIPQNQIPVSDMIPNTDSSKTLYEYEHQRLITVPNLPYRIVMRSLLQAPLQQQVQSTITNFNGSIAGNIIFKKRIDYSNNLNNPIAPIVTCPLSGVHINLYYTEPNGNVNVIASSRIQQNGNYQLNFNTNVDGSITQIPIWVGIVSDDGGINDNEFYNIRVHDLYNNSGTLYTVGIFSTTFNVNENGTTKMVSPIEVSEPHRAPFQALHYAHNAYRFVRQSYTSSEMPNDLIIYLKQHGLFNSSHYNSAYNTPRIFLQTGDDKLESVVYHEFGHHVMYKLQGDFYAKTGRIFKHPWTEEHSPREAWCEGWGYGFAQMCDLYYRVEDGESDWIKSIPTEDANPSMPPKDNSCEFRDPTVYANGSNGFKAEYFIACALYDLYDGADKFSSNASSDEYDDTPLYNSQGRGGYKSGLDKVSMSFREIADFFIWAKNQSNKEGFNIYSFWTWLMSNYTNDCDIHNINTIFRENRICNNVSDENYKNTQLLPLGSNNSTTYVINSPSTYVHLISNGLPSIIRIHGSAIDIFGFGNSNESNDFLLFQNETMANGTYIADDYIRAGENVGLFPLGPVLIGAVNKVIFKARNYIDLSPGFQTMPGDTFIAELLDCGNLQRMAIQNSEQSFSVNKQSESYKSLTDFNYNEKSHRLSSINRAAFSIYPNPAKNRFVIDYSLFEPSGLELYINDALGNVVKVIMYTNHTKEGIYKLSLDISDLSPGIYYVNMRTNQERETKKLIVYN